MVFGSCSQQVVSKGCHALARYRPVSLPEAVVAHAAPRGNVRDQELEHLEEGGRGSGGRGGIGSGLAPGNRGSRCSLGGVLPGGRVCFLDEGSTVNRGWEACKQVTLGGVVQEQPVPGIWLEWMEGESQIAEALHARPRSVDLLPRASDSCQRPLRWEMM